MAQIANGQQQRTFSHPSSRQAPITPESPNQPRSSWEANDEWALRQGSQPGAPATPSTGSFEHPSRGNDATRSTEQPTLPYTISTKRKAVPESRLQPGPDVKLQEAPVSPVSINPPRRGILEPEKASINHVDAREVADATNTSRKTHASHPSVGRVGETVTALPIRVSGRAVSTPLEQRASYYSHARATSSGYHNAPRVDERPEYEQVQETDAPQSPGLQYHHFEDRKPKYRVSQMTMSSGSSDEQHRRSGSTSLSVPKNPSRPASSHNLGSDLRGRTLSPLSANASDLAPGVNMRSTSRSPMSRPTSYIDLLNNLPYSQQIAPGPALNNHSLQSVVGSAASLLDTKKTLEMYRANVKKTNDAAVQYEFAIFMINAARDAMPGDGLDPNELTNEAKHILQRLADRAYPFAQYYLGDGYFSGLFNKGKPDMDKAFPLFVAASKHGHAEAGYRAALCYEFGWGTTKSYPKAVQFYRQSASKNHPGAATRLGLTCINGDMGLKDKYREGVKWLKRASESADFQYNAGPYELGVMHLNGYGDDIFKDEAYAAQLLTQSAELGHVEANFLMGRAYENGLYGCPRDAALSVHFYNGAATRGHVEGMMALCAWYMVGAEPVLEKDEGEAFAWAKEAAETGYAKAEYAIGYFTEMGIGCHRDPLEANMWYVRAADQGNETAKQRLAIIRNAISADSGVPMGKAEARAQELNGSKDKKKFMGIF